MIKNSFDYQFKIIFLGDRNVGKAQIINQYSDKQIRDIDTSYRFNLGSKILQIDNTKLKLQIFHPAGQEEFRQIAKSYYKNALGAIIVYDINNRNSFNSAEKWIDQLKLMYHAQFTLILVGNDRQINLYNERQVSFDEGQLFAKEFGIKFMEVCICNSKCIEQLFLEICQEILSKIKLGLIDQNDQSLGILNIKQQQNDTSEYLSHNRCQ